jgi:hypothetical protein
MDNTQPEVGGMPLPDECNGLHTSKRYGKAVPPPAQDFVPIREQLPDGSERVTLPWAGESILIEARVSRGLVEIQRERLPNGQERVTYRNILP